MARRRSAHRIRRSKTHAPRPDRDEQECSPREKERTRRDRPIPRDVSERARRPEGARAEGPRQAGGGEKTRVPLDRSRVERELSVRRVRAPAKEEQRPHPDAPTPDQPRDVRERGAEVRPIDRAGDPERSNRRHEDERVRIGEACDRQERRPRRERARALRVSRAIERPERRDPDRERSLARRVQDVGLERARRKDEREDRERGDDPARAAR